MNKIHFGKRVFALFPYFLILFYFCSCQCKNRCWETTTIEASCPHTTYSRSVLPPCNPFNGIEAEILTNGNNSSLFFNSKSLLFPTASSPYVSNVSIEICDCEYTIQADRLEGAQRLKIRPEDAQTILQALTDGHTVNVTTGRYQEVLIPFK